MAFKIPLNLVLAILVLLCALNAAFAQTESTTGTEKPRQVIFIHFQGLHAFSARDLKKIMTTKQKSFRWLSKAPLDEKVLEEDLERIQKFYQSNGFYHARIVSHKIVPLVGRDVRVEIEVHEGPPMVISGINLLVDNETASPWHEELRRIMPLKIGDRFTIHGYEEIERAIGIYLADWGYPKARVIPGARLDKRTNEASLSVEVVKGPVCYIGPVTVEGNEGVSEDVIRRELRFLEGDRFNGSKIRESQQRLFALDLFQIVDVSVENMESESCTLPVRILVKEAKKQTIRVGAGYGTEDNFRGQIQWEIRNFLGDGRRFQVNTKASSLVQLLEGKLLQPYLFDPASSFTLDGGIRHEDQESFENRRFYLSPTLHYKWSEKLNSYAGYDLEANRLLEVRVNDLGPADEENEEYYVSALVQGVLWEKVDAPLNPKEGVRFTQDLEFASIAFGSEVDYIKLVLEGRGYFPIRKYGTLAARLRWGGIQALENTGDVPIFKRFFAGGSESVRGYPYQRLGPLDEDGNPIGGMTLVEGSLEWRFPVRDPFEGVVFFDFGNVFEQSYDLLWDKLGYSLGAGIRYLTLVGPLRLDFGYALDPPEQDFFNPYQIHFSIGQAF